MRLEYKLLAENQGISSSVKIITEIKIEVRN